MNDATSQPIPRGFIPVFGALPQENQNMLKRSTRLVPMLAIRLSGYTGSIFKLVTAHYMATYRPRSP